MLIFRRCIVFIWKKTGCLVNFFWEGLCQSHIGLLPSGLFTVFLPIFKHVQHFLSLFKHYTFYLCHLSLQYLCVYCINFGGSLKKSFFTMTSQNGSDNTNFMWTLQFTQTSRMKSLISYPNKVIYHKNSRIGLILYVDCVNRQRQSINHENTF
jgi:hypothetical protein